MLRVLLPLWFTRLRLLHVWFHVLPVLEILPSTPSYDTGTGYNNSLRRTDCSVR